MRIQGVVLEYHGEIAVLRRYIIGKTISDINVAGGHFFQAGDHSQCCGFSATARPDNHHELAIGNIQIEIVDRRNFAFENLGDIFQ